MNNALNIVVVNVSLYFIIKNIYFYILDHVTQFFC